MRQVGPYVIERLLGNGAQGEVFLAHDQQQQAVALKMVHAHLAGDIEVTGRFQRESRVAMNITHPNVVSTLNAGVEDGRPWLAYAYITGGDLEGLLQQRQRLTPAHALQITADIMSGLEALHIAGLIHRDIKPANILLDNGRARISDHGLARSTCDARTQYTQTGALVGSPAFMAPEQIEGSPFIDIRADIYATGVVFYEMLCGELPFSGQNIVSILNKHLTEAIPNINRLLPNCDAAYQGLLNAFMAKDPNQRPKDPTAALALIRQVAQASQNQANPMAFPATLDGDTMPINAIFPATLDSSGTILPPSADNAFPMTLDEATAFSAEFPSTIDQNTAFPSTLDQSPAFPATLDQQQDKSNKNGFELGNFKPFKEQQHETAALPLHVVQLARDSQASAAQRVRISVNSADGAEQQLFIYAGTQLRLGRTGLDRTDAEVCLRLRPAAGNEEAIRKISGHHLSILINADGAAIRDENSSCGTSVNNKTLTAGTSQALTHISNLNVAGVINLVAHCIPAAQHLYHIDGEPKRQTKNGVGGVWISRPENGREHHYVLVHNALGINRDLNPDATAEAQLLCIEDSLWLLGGGLPENQILALHPGVRFTLGDVSFQVHLIQPADQK